jgi:hypothetical protein
VLRVQLSPEGVPPISVQVRPLGAKAVAVGNIVSMSEKKNTYNIGLILVFMYILLLHNKDFNWMYFYSRIKKAELTKGFYPSAAQLSLYKT